MGGDRRRPFIAIPEIEETGMYEVVVDGYVMEVNVVIERQWKTYQHDYDTPPEDICTYEYINITIEGIFDENGLVNHDYDYDYLKKEINKDIIRYKA